MHMIPVDPESAAANGICLKQLLWVRCGDAPTEKPSNAVRNRPFNLKRPWTRFDQAIRSTDLLLQAGGFAAIVLDLADEAIEHGRRTFRLQRGSGSGRHLIARDAAFSCWANQHMRSRAPRR